ncbi:MAG: hypothetical protein K0R22_3489, partial [Sporomusa sp.]|nr:hypothetical protein [Sporomusa sp.]
MEELLKQLLEGQKQITQRLDRMDSHFDRVESDFTELKTTVSNIDGQQSENTDFIKALLHRTEELNAQAHN